MNDARSEHIHKTPPAISSGVPNRPMGCKPRANFLNPGSANRRSPMGVSITAGHTTLIRMPLRAVSRAAAFVSPITPCLLALYVAAPGEPISPATEAILTMAPPRPCLSIC